MKEKELQFGDVTQLKKKPALSLNRRQRRAIKAEARRRLRNTTRKGKNKWERAE